MKLPIPKTQKDKNTMAVFASCDWSRLPESFSISLDELQKNLDADTYNRWRREAGGDEYLITGLSGLVDSLIKHHSKQDLEFVKIAYLKQKALE